MRVHGINSVLEALKARKINKILVKNSQNPKVKKIIERAKKEGIPVYTVRNLPEKIAADVSPINYVDFDYIIKKTLEESSFALVLDNISDQRNLGACIRTAEFFDCAGILIPKRRAAQIGEGAVRTSAGAVFHVNVAREENIASAIKKAKKYGLFVVGADLDGVDISSVDLSPPLVLIIGGEDRGISHPVKKMCDEIVKIHGKGKVESLNLSVAAGILMYEISRRR